MAEFERLRKFVELPKLPPSQLEDKMSESVQVMRRMLAQQDVDDKFSDGLRMSIEAIERARQDQERFRTELTFLATLFRIKDGRLVRVSGKLSEALDTVTRDLGLRPGESAEIGALRVHAVAALHGDLPTDAYSFDGAAGDGACRFLGYVFDADGICVYHAGDTIAYPGLAEEVRRLAPDVALLPINGRDAEREAQDIVGNLDETEAVDLAAEAGVDLLVPMHWDMFAANPGSPGRVVDLAVGRGLGVFVPSHDRSLVYGRALRA